MNRIKRLMSLLLAAACLFLCGCGSAFAQETLTLALYQGFPNYEEFEKTVRKSWQEIHPETELEIVDWNCYGENVPEDLDVFVIDATNLDLFAEKGFLLPLSEEDIREYDDLIPFFLDGCRVNGTIYVVPQILCTDMLYTREDDAELHDVRDLATLRTALGDSGLLMDKGSATIAVLHVYAGDD